MIRGIIFDCFGVLHIPIPGTTTFETTRNDTLLRVVSDLRKKYKTGLISNMDKEMMMRFFDAQESDQLFDTVVLSGEESVAKPDPRIFEIAAWRLDLLPEECVMIDDVDTYCRGAEEAGMKAIVYQSNEQLENELNALLKEANA